MATDCSFRHPSLILSSYLSVMACATGSTSWSSLLPTPGGATALQGDFWVSTQLAFPRPHADLDQ